MKALLDKHRSNLALVIGNGVNRYGAAKSTNSWQELLIQLAEKHLPSKLQTLPKGVTLTEFTTFSN